jgi:hypothetical protein
MHPHWAHRWTGQQIFADCHWKMNWHRPQKQRRPQGRCRLPQNHWALTENRQPQEHLWFGQWKTCQQ